MKKRIVFLLKVCLFAAISSSAYAAAVENVRAAQRPRSNVVEIFYDLEAPEGGVYAVSVSIAGGGDAPALSTLSGDFGPDIIPGRNKKIEWDAGADWSQHVQSNLVATVTATRLDAELSMGMVFIPGGTNSDTDPDFGPYSLSVESFYMDKTEITYAHWKRVYNWALQHGYSFDNQGSGKGNNHPVHTINWYDCVKWCNARSEMEGLTPTYLTGGVIYRVGQFRPDEDFNANGYSLPTDTEWEYAARGGLRSKLFPWGNIISHSKANYYGDDSLVFDMSGGYHPNFSTEGTPFTSPVASFAANGFGLYDMAGNVWEWTNPVAGFDPDIRGGSWCEGSYFCRCQKSGWDSGFIYPYPEPSLHHAAHHAIGFRSVRRH